MERIRIHFTISTLFFVGMVPTQLVPSNVIQVSLYVMFVLSDFIYILNLNNRLKFRVPNNIIVDTIICEIDIIMCDIGTINVRFYLLEVPYHQWYHHM